jgi:hypothetical protein
VHDDLGALRCEEADAGGADAAGAARNEDAYSLKSGLHNFVILI